MSDTEHFIKIGSHYINIRAISRVARSKKYVTIYLTTADATLVLKEPEAAQFIRWLDQRAQAI